MITHDDILIKKMSEYTAWTEDEQEFEDEQE